MTKYIYAECSSDYWPIIKTIVASSYNNAVDKLIQKYGNELDDDDILNFDSYEDMQDHLNENYSIALSNLEDIEEL